MNHGKVRPPLVNLWGVYSVWRRHALVYWRTWLVNFLPPVTEPIFYLLSFGFGITPMVAYITINGNQVGYLRFIYPAMIAVGVSFQAFFEAAYGSFIRLKFQRTWHALLTAPLGYNEIFFGDLTWAATRGIIGGIVTGLVTVLLGQIRLIDLIACLPIIVLGSVMFASLGMTVAGWVKTVDQINVPVFLFIAPMFSLCGTFFPRTNLPDGVRQFAGLLPMAQVIDLLRLPLGYDPYWALKTLGLCAWTAGGTYLGWRFIRPQVFR